MLSLADQKHILKRYQEQLGPHTLRQMSDETGIQISRLFRLHHGSAMRWNEYLTFQRLIEEKGQNAMPEVQIRKVIERFFLAAQQHDQEEVLERMQIICRMRELKMRSHGGLK